MATVSTVEKTLPHRNAVIPTTNLLTTNVRELKTTKKRNRVVSHKSSMKKTPRNKYVDKISQGDMDLGVRLLDNPVLVCLE